MRLIDADELKKLIKDAIYFNSCAREDGGLYSRPIYKGFAKAIDTAPTIDAVPVVWHKVTTRPLTEEEKEYYADMEMDGIEYIFDCEMPEDGQEILVATKWGTDKDICSDDCDYGIGLEVRGDWDGVYAWAEMPQYKGEAE